MSSDTTTSSRRSGLGRPPLQLGHIANAADADISVYADLDRAGLAGCIVSTSALALPDRDPA